MLMPPLNKLTGSSPNVIELDRMRRHRCDVQSFMNGWKNWLGPSR